VANDFVQYSLLNMVYYLAPLLNVDKRLIAVLYSNHLAKNSNYKPAMVPDIQASALIGGIFPHNHRESDIALTKTCI